MKSLFCKALSCENTGRPPVWIMRQAGRYLPEYRKIRERASFMEMVQTPDLAAEITLLPIRRFGMDAAILFADILLVVETMGQKLSFVEGVGPLIEHPLQKKQDVEKIVLDSAKERLSFVSDTIKIVKKDLSVPLLGFAGAPFTVASYMIEGGASKDLKKTKKWLMQDPDSFHLLLQKITAVTVEYLQMQEKAGVDAIQIFESWAGALGHTQMKEFSLCYMKQLKDSLSIPTIVFGRGANGFIPDLISIQPSGISLDWGSNLAAVREIVPKNIALQGNLDPHVLYADRKTIQKECTALLKQMREDRGYIFNLGHGILPDVDPDSVQILVDTVKRSADG